MFAALWRVSRRCFQVERRARQAGGSVEGERGLFVFVDPTAAALA